MLRKLFATIGKDLSLLRRDRAGLLVLFVMPAILVVIITLVQNNVYSLLGETAPRVILVDLDGGDLGRRVIDRMERLELLTTIDGKPVSAELAVDLVNGGDFQAAIFIKEGTGSRLLGQVTAEVNSSLLQEKSEINAVPELEIIFDPTVMGGFRTSLRSSLAMVLLEFEVEAKMAALTDILPIYLTREMKKAAGDYADFIEVPPIAINLPTKPILSVVEGAASRDGGVVIPTPAQHNVPAWALFGMFFIVVPMAGSLIREREEGTLARLLSMPIMYPVILAGKISAYVMVCCGQFLLIFLIGVFVLPLLGVAPLQAVADWGAVIFVVVAASFAAAGYGILLGTVSRTYEQASMFGAISVVAASAIGGVMVPVYAMPEVMQKISVISPIGWGLEAFLAIFVRGSGLGAVSFELTLLLLFAFLAALLAWLTFIRRPVIN